MKEIRTEIGISATPEKVWEILTNLQGWSDWNPIVHKIEGNMSLGQELLIVMTSEQGKSGKSYRAKITSFDINRRFSFSSKMMTKFLFSIERKIDLENSESGIQFIQTETYSGILVPLFWNKMKDQVTKMLNSMNEALKKKVEIKN